MGVSEIGDNSTAAASKLKEVALPVYADDLPANVREGFDKTCVYIKDCTDALEERLNSKFEAITSRLDALADNLINPSARAEPPPAATLQDELPRRDGHADGRLRRPVVPVQGGVDADLEDDAGYAPQQRTFDGRPAAALRIGHAARVPLDDGIGRVKISIPPFSGSGSPEDFLEWEMRLDHIFSTDHYTGGL